MKELLRSNDPTVLAFASAILQGEDIECFELDVNMSALFGGINAIPRRLMVREKDYFRACQAMTDNQIPMDQE